MRKPLLKARQLLLLAYLLAAVLWVVRCLVGCGVMLNYKLQGKMPQTHVDAAELVTESFAPYSSNEWWTPPDDDPAWYLSTDSDPHIYWQGQGYIETAVLDAAHRLPPGGVALYYLKPGQTDYTEAQKVYARVTAPGVYTFDLGGQWVTGLRIDPDSVGGVPTLFTGIDLNPPRPWYTRFVPTAGWWLVLAFVPAVAAAMASAVCSFFIKKEQTALAIAAATAGTNASTSHQPAVGTKRVYHGRGGFRSMPVNSVGTPPTLSGSMRSPVTHCPPKSNV